MDSSGDGPIDDGTEQDGHLIVGIGASAGGLDAFRSFFSEMPVDSGMAFVLVQHLDPDYNSALAEIIGECTSMPVVKAADGTIAARFRFDGTTCSNLGHSLAFPIMSKIWPEVAGATSRSAAPFVSSGFAPTAIGAGRGHPAVPTMPALQVAGGLPSSRVPFG